MADHSYEDVMTALRNADAAGDHEAAPRLRAIASGMKSSKSQADQIPGGMSPEKRAEELKQYKERNEKNDKASLWDKAKGVADAGLSAVSSSLLAPVAGAADVLS